MDISSLQRHVKPAALPLDKLAGNGQIPQQEKVAEVARQFEAVLLRHILGEAQKTVFASKVNSGSVSSDIYKDMVTAQMADRVSESGGFGLARSLEHQLSHEIRGKAPAAPAPATADKKI